MADSVETKALLLQIDASVELLKQNLKQGDAAVAAFVEHAEEKLSLIDRTFEATGEKVREHAGEIAAAFAAFFAVEHLIDLGKEGLEYAASLGEVSKQLGTTVEFLQQFRFAAQQAGVSQEEADKGLQKFTRTLSQARAGVKEAAGVFHQLGFTDEQIKNLSQPDAFIKAADGISKLRDNVTRAAPEVALFGKAGQQLDPLLSQGGAGIAKLAQAAQDLGIVLSAEQVEKAELAAHKFEELKTVLEANIASFVADNADAIYGLASALEKLALEAVQFVKDAKLNIGALADVFEPFVKNGESAFERLGIKVVSFHDQIVSILQGFDEIANIPIDINNKGARFDQKYLSGLPGYPVQPIVARSDLAGDFERASRDRETEEGLERLDRNLKPSETEPHGAGYTDPAAAAAAARAAEEAKRKAAELAKQAAERAKRALDESNRLDDAYLSAQEGLTADTVERAQIEREKLARDTAGKLADLDAQVKAKQLNAADAAALKAKIERNAAIENDAINQKENVALEQQSFDLANARLGVLKDELGSASTLATTSKDRLAIALRVLAAEKEDERSRLQAIADDEARLPKDRHYSQGAIDVAKTELSSLDERYAGREAVARQENAGPLDSYRRQLQQSVGDTNEALQTIEVGGLGDLETAFEGILTGSKSVASAIKSMVSSIIADLAKLVIEKGIFSLLKKSGGGGSSAVDVFGGLFAEGGHVKGPGSGTSDSIVARLSNGEFVVNAKATERFLPVLHAMNDNRFPGFAGGGLVGSLPTIAYPRIATADLRRDQAPRFTVEAKPNPYFDIRVSQVAGTMDQQAAPRTAAAGASLAARNLAKSRRRSLASAN